MIDANAVVDVWRIAVFGTPDDPHEVADVLSQTLGIHRIDALQHARSAPGLLPDRVSENDAARIVASLAELGLSGAAIPERDIPALKDAPHVHHVRCVAEGLEILDLRGDVQEVVAWPEFTLLSLGLVPEDRVRRFETAGPMVITSAPAPPLHSHTFPIAEGPEAWLFAGNPVRCWRIDHLQMNYEYLEARMASSAAVNFRTLIGDILERAPQIHRTPATRAWLEHLPAEKFRYATSAELEHETIRHWLAMRDATEGSTQPPAV